MEWAQKYIDRFMEWLKPKPTVKQPDPKPHEPFHLADGHPLKAVLDRIHAKIKADFPHIQIPPIHSITNHDAFRTTYHPHQPKSKTSASYLPHESVVVIDAKILTLLSVDQAAAVITHEYGHHYSLKHYGSNRQPLNQLRGLAGITSMSAYSRSNECEADQFMAHYLPSARTHLLSALAKLREAENTPHHTTTLMYQSHPADPVRLAGREAHKAIAMKPGTVTFDGLCNALFPSPPLRPVAPPPGTLSR